MAEYNGSIELISGLKQANGQDFPLVDASAVQVDESGTRLDKALEDKVGKSEIDDIASSSISVSETEPTKDSAEVWINPSTKENFSVPEIKDDTVNTTDTWSSKKIESEISSLKSNIDSNTENIKNNKILVDSNLENSGQAADAKTTGDAITSINEYLNNLQNYKFFENYVYGKIITDSITGNNVTVVKNLTLPVGDYFIYAKFDIAGITVAVNTRLYVQQANYNGNITNINADGEYVLSGMFSIDSDGTGVVRIDHFTSDSNRTTTLKSLFIVKYDDSAIESIIDNDSYRKIVIAYAFDEKYLPSDVAKKQDIKNANSEIYSHIINAEPIFDLFKDYGNRNYKICLIGDSTSDGDAGPAIGIYTALAHHQKSGELLEGATVIDMGRNGSTAEAYIGSYADGSGSLYDAIQVNADIYIVCLGINDVRLGLCDKDTLKSRLVFIVDEILKNTKGRVILRTPNSLGNDDTNEQYIVPYTSAQEYTDILWNAYDELKNYWDCTRVRILDMQTLIFGRKSIASATNPLMGDVLHPNSNKSSTTLENDFSYGMNMIGTVIAYALGRKEVPNMFECLKAKKENEEEPYMVYPLILDSNEYIGCKLYEWTPNIPVNKSYVQFYNLNKESVELKKGDILKFGNEFCKIYNGETLQNVGTLLHITISFTEEEIEKSKNVWHVSVYRVN